MNHLPLNRLLELAKLFFKLGVMASKYSVIQYVPDPIADERINIGVIAFDNQNIRTLFQELAKLEKSANFWHGRY
jgi:Protein of unknown function (DUF3037)